MEVRGYETRSSFRDSEHLFPLTRDCRPGLSSVTLAGLGWRPTALKSELIFVTAPKAPVLQKLF